MKLKEFRKVKDGTYLKNYELVYENKEGREKVFEIVSRNELKTADDIGIRPSGVSIVAFCEDRMLLLKEFRMGVNRYLYNLCAGMFEANETIEETIRRELMEETGLELDTIIDILPPSFAAVAISDVSTQIAIVTVKGTPAKEGGDANESIFSRFYTRDEMQNLLKTEEFASRAQVMAYMFTKGFPNFRNKNE